MFVESPNAALKRLLRRPDLAIVAEGVAITLDPACAVFAVGPGRLRLPPPLLGAPDAAVSLRHGIEIALWRAAGAPPALAGIAAARIAARFAGIERLVHASETDAATPNDATTGKAAEWARLVGDAPPEGLGTLWRRLVRHQPGADPALPEGLAARLAALWPLLDPAERLLQSGGDGRLLVDPATGLNGYGASHRPRPWAVTFASSTASSSSERGFAAAERARRALLRRALADGAPAALRTLAAEVRQGIAEYAQAPAGTQVILAASGTDAELAALAIALAGGGKLTSVLLAPEETGSGVPLAARGRHFAGDTACGGPVGKGSLVAGFPADSGYTGIALRHPDGTLRDNEEVADACRQAIMAALGEGRRVLLHPVDQSKTGLQAPGEAVTREMVAAGQGRVDVLVDAAQGRVDPSRLRAWLEAGWMVLLTGSKFFTGPPFSGAILLPPSLAARLDEPLPSGLGAYARRLDWPEGSRAASGLPEGANLGLLLRWQAALAEMRAFGATDPAWRTDVLQNFAATLREAIAFCPDLRMLDTPGPARGDALWDNLPTVFSFLLLGRPDQAGRRVPLGMDDARLVYAWLNSDLRACLPHADPLLAGLRCHVGQPVAIGTNHGPAGALRISAGARLISGEPSLAPLDPAARLARELGDLRAVVAKIALVMRQFEVLRRGDPRPTFR